MTIAHSVAPYLPYLRRFARALTGSQESGDAYVVAVLEAMIEDASVFDAGLAPRVALHRVFLKVWNSVAVNEKVEAADVSADGPAEERLKLITPRPRQAFLLATVEGFSTVEVGQIMEIPADEVADLINQAGQEIAGQIAADVLIIEDEPLIAMDIEALVADLGHRVQGIARTHTEAIAAVAKQTPGLVLADIQLADGSSGLEAVNEILQSLTVPVVFITAYPERLLTGQKPEPAFLITKPFQPDTVKAIISQALFFGTSARRKEKRAA